MKAPIPMQEKMKINKKMSRNRPILTLKYELIFAMKHLLTFEKDKEKQKYIQYISVPLS